MKPLVFNYADHLRLQAEMDKHNEYANALKAENERLRAALSDMRFAYVNKDNPPHQFEIEALNTANEILGGNYGH